MVDILFTQFTVQTHPSLNGFISKVRDGIVPMARSMKVTVEGSLNLELMVTRRNVSIAW